MKKIGIDCRLIGRTGVGVYIKNLIYYLEQIAPDNLLFYIYLITDDFSQINFKKKNFIKVRADYHWHSFKEQIHFYIKLQKDNLDLMHFTYFSYPFLYRKNFIATIHDLTPILFKTGRASTKNPLIYQTKHALFRFVLGQEVKNAKKIITPCSTVKKQIVNYFGNKYERKISPIYEGVSYELINANENRNLENNFTNDFFIYVGNFYPHKNVEKLIQAFSRVDSKTQLILLGPDDYFTKRIFQLIQELKQEKRIILYKNAKPEALVYFYKNAKALINPSLSEGFGLPLVEALYFGCPVIASDIEVFREILGDNYVKFDPYSINDFILKINNFLIKEPKFTYKDLIKQYSFETMAKETLKLYQVNLHI